MEFGNANCMMLPSCCGGAHIKAGDCFAGLVMVREAGGEVSFGGPHRLTHGGPMLAAAPRVFKAARDLLGASGV